MDSRPGVPHSPVCILVAVFLTTETLFQSGRKCHCFSYFRQCISSLGPEDIKTLKHLVDCIEEPQDLDLDDAQPPQTPKRSTLPSAKALKEPASRQSDIRLTVMCLLDSNRHTFTGQVLFGPFSLTFACSWPVLAARKGKSCTPSNPTGFDGVHVLNLLATGTG